MVARQSVGPRELKTRLGKYIRAVRGGATFVVTERGEAVAELRPIETQRDLDSVLDHMAACGMLSVGTGEVLPPFSPIPVRGAAVSKTIREQRGDRF